MDAYDFTGLGIHYRLENEEQEKELKEYERKHKRGG